MFSNEAANEGFTAEFIRYTNCLDPKPVYDSVEELEADYYVAIPENGGMLDVRKLYLALNPTH